MRRRCPLCNTIIIKADHTGQRYFPLSNYTCIHIEFERSTQLKGAGGKLRFEEDENEAKKRAYRQGDPKTPIKRVDSHIMAVPCCKDCAKNFDYQEAFDKIFQHSPAGKIAKSEGYTPKGFRIPKRKKVNKIIGE